MRPAIFFDDARGRLAPLTDLRPAAAIRTGALTTMERLTAAFDLTPIALRVPAEIAAIAAEATGLPVNTLPALRGPVLLISARCVLPHEQIRDLPVGHAIVESGSGDVVAAHLAPEHVPAFLDAPGPLREGGPAGGIKVRATLPAPALLSRPWHTRTFRDAALRFDLEHLTRLAAGERPAAAPPAGVCVIGGSAVSIHPGARIYPAAVIDAEAGPVVVDDGAVVRPGATLIGPAFIGRGTTVADRAVIKSNTAIGPACKVGGEVGGTIFQGNANKVHDGHLGDAWVGEWANFGAGTTNSNLLNTYGDVVSRVLPDDPMERTGEQFFGCVVGDHAKFAICTRIMTGAIVHTGAMIATTGAVAGSIGRFAWSTDTVVRLYRLDKFLDVARTVMLRRGVEPSAAYLDRLASLHARATAP